MRGFGERETRISHPQLLDRHFLVPRTQVKSAPERGARKMRKSPHKGLAVVAAAVAAAAIAVPLGFGSSHREAPNIALDPSADNTDVYAFTAKDAPDALTIASDWIPGQVPANGPNFFRFDDRAQVLREHRQHRRRRCRHQVPVQVQDQRPEPELLPVRRPGDTGLHDPGPERDSALRPDPADAEAREGEAREGGRPQAPRGAAEHRAEDVPELPELRRPVDQDPGRRHEGVRGTA